MLFVIVVNPASLLASKGCCCVFKNIDWLWPSYVLQCSAALGQKNEIPHHLIEHQMKDACHASKNARRQMHQTKHLPLQRRDLVSYSQGKKEKKDTCTHALSLFKGILVGQDCQKGENDWGRLIKKK